MSSDNVKLVQSLYAAFGRGDIAAIVQSCAPHVVWRTVGRRSDFPAFGEHRGHAGVQSFFDTVGAELTFSEFVPTEFHAADDKVFALGHYAMTVKKTGRPIRSEWLHMITIREGKVIAFREFTDTAQAAEAYRG